MEMEYRVLGRTGWHISTIGFGAWGIGGDVWGPTDDATSLAALHKAVDLGVNFVDTADVYGGGHSERLVGLLRRQRREAVMVATKAGRRFPRQLAAYYTRQNLTLCVEDSLRNLQMEAIDLLQLHCPPPDLYDQDEAFDILDDLVRQGKLRFYGVSVETVDEALRAIKHPNVQSVQLVFNMFRFKPAEQFFAVARARQVGVLARVPLASGLLTGKFRPDTQFLPQDHRTFNRHGEAFDQGETFAGVDYTTGLHAVEELRKLTPPGMTMAQLALRWITMFPDVTTTIPGAKNPLQAENNALAGSLPPLSSETMQGVRSVYDTYIRPLVQSRW